MTGSSGFVLKLLIQKSYKTLPRFPFLSSTTGIESKFSRYPWKDNQDKLFTLLFIFELGFNFPTLVVISLLTLQFSDFETKNVKMASLRRLLSLAPSVLPMTSSSLLTSSAR